MTDGTTDRVTEARARQPTGAELSRGLLRAAAGAGLFAMPLFLTMETWQIAVVGDPLRLAAFVVVDLAVVLVLVRRMGFRDSAGLRLSDHIADTFVAVAVGASTALLVLTATGVVDSSRPTTDVVRLVGFLLVPASVGAAIARSQVASSPGDGRARFSSYPHEVMLMAIGCLVFAFNIAPTEEVVMLATRIGDLQAAGLAMASVVLLHAIVYMMGFRGQHRSEAPFWSVFLGYTVAGYATVLLVCAGLLWVFGQTADVALPTVLARIVVLGLPGTLGAGAARLLL